MQTIKSLWPIIAAILSAVLGWNLKDVQISGSTTPSGTIGIGALTLTSGVAILFSTLQAWKHAGGKLDGVLTTVETKVLIDAVAKALNLSPESTAKVDQYAGEASALANGLIGWMKKTFSDTKPPNLSQPDKVALLMNAQQALAWELNADELGRKAVATVLERLHAVWNAPTTSNSDSEPKISVV